MTDVDTRASGADDQTDLTALRLPALVALATELGVPGASRLRKGDLVTAITAARAASGEAPAAEAPVEADAPVEAPADTVVDAPAQDAVAAPAQDVAVDEGGAETPTVAASTADAAPAEAEQAPASGSGRNRRGSRRATMGDAEARAAAAAVVEELVGSQPAQGGTAPRGARSHVAEADLDSLLDSAPTATEGESGDGSETPAEGGQQGGGRSRNRNRRGGGNGNGQQNQNGGQNGNGGQAKDGQNGNQANGNGGQQNQNGNGGNGPQGDDAEGGERSSRSRYRDRKRGRGPANDEFEPEILDDDVLIPVAGILDVLENYAFVRTSGYLPGNNDVYVSLGQVKKYNLRKGDAVVGAVRQPREGEQQGRQKYNAIVKIDSVNGLPVDEIGTRVEFSELTPLYPQERLRLETESSRTTARLVDLVAPIGKGQRGLVVSPPKAGKTLVLKEIAQSIAKNNPEVHLMVVLVDERPEEVTDMQRAVKGEVIASTFDRPAEDHTTVAELAIERAKRLVELGYDVVVLLDSLTRLGRAYNQVAPTSGRTIAGGMDAAALTPPKRIFGAARNVEEGGSLTIIATALVGTGSAADEAIFEEFQDADTMELRLSRALADKRIFPAVDVTASGTRREELLLGADEVRVLARLRRTLADVGEQQALERVLGTLTSTSSNVEFLLATQKSLPED